MSMLKHLGRWSSSPAPGIGPETNGRAFLGLIKHVKEEKGVTTLNEIIARSNDRVKQMFSERIWASMWYPYKTYVDFLNAIDIVLGKGDGSYCYTLGKEAGKRDIGSIFQIYLAFSSAEKLIRSCGKIWTKYYRSAGSMEAVSCEKENTVLRILDFPEMDIVHCHLMEGWMASTMLAIGFVTSDIKEVLCMSKGHPYHEFRCTWSKLAWRR